MPHNIGCGIDAAGINCTLELRIGVDLAYIAFVLITSEKNIHTCEIESQCCGCGKGKLFLKR